jgi:tetratricopeptide (TPR) repeat protein
MSRAGLPRRFCVLGLIVSLAACLAAADAAAQSDPRAVTVIGSSGDARRCSEAVMTGDVSDRTVETCSRALNYRGLERVVRLQVLTNRGVAHLRRQEFESALADFDAVAAIDRRNAEVQLNRGAALVQLQRHGEAIAAITEALGLGVTEPHKAYFNRGAAREALGDLRGAYEDYNTALEIQPDWGPANAELARFARTRRAYLANVLNEPAPTP